MYDKEIHHRRSIRLPGADYSAPDFYFVTICAADKKCIFGHIHNGEMILNKLGKIVHKAILDIPKYCDDKIKIHEFVVMPNHIHIIIELTAHIDVGADIIRPESSNGQVIPAPTTVAYKYSKTLGSVIRGFKSGITKQIGKSIWQRNYYEHIIRDNADYEKIANYIFTNPKTWDADALYQKQLDEFNKQFNVK